MILVPPKFPDVLAVQSIEMKLPFVALFLVGFPGGPGRVADWIVIEDEKELGPMTFTACTQKAYGKFGSNVGAIIEAKAVNPLLAMTTD